VAFLVDRCENVYVSGWGGTIPSSSFTLAGTKGLTTVNPILKSTTDGQDLYFFVLKKNATQQLYGDFFGQDGGFIDHVDGEQAVLMPMVSSIRPFVPIVMAA
jgi:hypothetical protein